MFAKIDFLITESLRFNIAQGGKWMPVVDYRSKSHHGPWRPPKIETAVETLVVALCIAANAIVPFVLVAPGGRSPLSAAMFCGAGLSSMVLANLWVGARCNRSLAQKGLRRNAWIRVISIILVPLSLLNACLFTPLLAQQSLKWRVADHLDYQRIAFERATLLVNDYCTEHDIYPSDLAILIRHRDTTLMQEFPDASPAQIKDLELLAEALNTREPTVAEADLIAQAGHLKYVGLGLLDKDMDDDYLVLISTSAAGPNIQLGYSSGRIDRVASATVGGIILKENAKRTARGIPAIIWP